MKKATTRPARRYPTKFPLGAARTGVDAAGARNCGYVRTWHVEAIAWRLERVRRGEVRRLIINLPPRSLKSIAASVAFPAFALGHDSSRRIICVSYFDDLAKKHANDFRAVLESPWYRSAFPNRRIGPFKNSETEIELTARGVRLATSVGGTLTGRAEGLVILIPLTVVAGGLCPVGAGHGRS
jgi:hypothetical protein